MGLGLGFGLRLGSGIDLGLGMRLCFTPGRENDAAGEASGGGGGGVDRGRGERCGGVVADRDLGRRGAAALACPGEGAVGRWGGEEVGSLS